MFHNGVGHGYPLIRRFEIKDFVTCLNFCCSVKRQSYAFQYLLGELHHPDVVFVSHINFHSGEFRIVRPVHSLVAEIFCKLINSVETANNQTFQVKLVGNAQIERNVQRVVVCFKGTGCGTAGNRL